MSLLQLIHRFVQTATERQQAKRDALVFEGSTRQRVRRATAQIAMQELSNTLRHVPRRARRRMARSAR